MLIKSLLYKLRFSISVQHITNIERGVDGELQIADQLLEVLADGEYGYVILGEGEGIEGNWFDIIIDGGRFWSEWGGACIMSGGGLMGTLGGLLCEAAT